GVEAQKEVRIDREVRDLAALPLVEAGEKGTAPPAVATHRLDAVTEAHRAAAVARRRCDVLGAELVMQPVQRRMQLEARQALLLVEDNQLPVGLHVVDDAPAET